MAAEEASLCLCEDDANRHENSKFALLPEHGQIQNCPDVAASEMNIDPTCSSSLSDSPTTRNPTDLYAVILRLELPRADLHAVDRVLAQRADFLEKKLEQRRSRGADPLGELGQQVLQCNTRSMCYYEYHIESNENEDSHQLWRILPRVRRMHRCP